MLAASNVCQRLLEDRHKCLTLCIQVLPKMALTPCLQCPPSTLTVSRYRYMTRNILSSSCWNPRMVGSNQYWESLDNPVAGELGITTRQELEDFLENALPKFKLVTHCRLGPNVARLR